MLFFVENDGSESEENDSEIDEIVSECSTLDEDDTCDDDPQYSLPNFPHPVCEQEFI